MLPIGLARNYNGWLILLTCQTIMYQKNTDTTETAFLVSDCSSYLLPCCDRIADESSLQKSSFLVAHSSRVCQSITVRVGSSCSYCRHSRETEKGECWCSACFLLFIQPRSPAYGMVLPTVTVGLPTKINPM